VLPFFFEGDVGAKALVDVKSIFISLQYILAHIVVYILEDISQKMDQISWHLKTSLSLE